MEDEPYQEIYFIGISLPEPLNREVSTLQWRLQATDPAMLKPLLPHVTLLHPPSLAGIMPSELIPKIREVATRYLPLTISLEEIDFFGKSVCYIKAQSLALFSLQSQLVQLLPSEAQALHYKRAYMPHVTMAQIYDPRILDKAVVTKMITDELDLPIQFTIDSVTCFRRILPREYKAEAI